MGRLLAVYEKAELDTYTAEELKMPHPECSTVSNNVCTASGSNIDHIATKDCTILKQVKKEKI